MGSEARTLESQTAGAFRVATESPALDHSPLTTHHSPLTTPYLHAWAVLTVVVTVVAMTTGGVVTTFRVGMADPVWPTAPWHLLLISWTEPSPGFIIEHTHRLADYTLGLCIIILAAWLWREDRRPRMRWLGPAALAGVIVQGLIGGLRVKLHELVGTDLALIHGCFASCLLALLAGIAVLTSRRWTTLPPESGRDAGPLARWAVFTAGLIFVQLVLGAVVRHTDSPAGQRLHFLTAFAVVAAAAWLIGRVGEGSRTRQSSGLPSGLTRPAFFLGALIVLQLLLGVESWMIRFGSGVMRELQTVTIRQGAVRTAHFITGALIFATAVVLALEANRFVVTRFIGSGAEMDRLKPATTNKGPVMGTASDGDSTVLLPTGEQTA